MDNSKTGATPGRGKGLRAKLGASNAAVRADQERLETCPGFPAIRVRPDTSKGTIEFSNANRSNCSICGMSTPYYCLICKRFYCIDKDRSKRVEALVKKREREIMIEGSYCTPIDFFKGVAPPSVIKTVVATKADDATMLEANYFRNSCYQMRHRHAMEKLR